MSARLTTALRVDLLRRRVECEGGFATVLHRGDPGAGELLLLIRSRDGALRLFVPRLSLEGAGGFDEELRFADGAQLQMWLDQRVERDRDLWIVELDTANPERLVVELGTFG